MACIASCEMQKKKKKKKCVCVCVCVCVCTRLCVLCCVPTECFFFVVCACRHAHSCVYVICPIASLNVCMPARLCVAISVCICVYVCVHMYAYASVSAWHVHRNYAWEPRRCIFLPHSMSLGSAYIPVSWTILLWWENVNTPIGCGGPGNRRLCRLNQSVPLLC